MAKSKKFRFNVKNVKYATINSEGRTYNSPVDLAYAKSISLEANFNETELYGDGEVIGVLANDKGKTGTLSVTDINEEYEVAMGRAMKIKNGLADIEQKSSIPHAIYFETDVLENGDPKTVKTWLLNVTTGKPSETYNQTEDSPTINGYDYSLKVMGVDLMDNTGAEVYKDTNGNTIKVYRITAMPGDEGYDTFEQTVPTPQVQAE